MVTAGFDEPNLDRMIVRQSDATGFRKLFTHRTAIWTHLDAEASPAVPPPACIDVSKTPSYEGKYNLTNYDEVELSS